MRTIRNERETALEILNLADDTGVPVSRILADKLTVYQFSSKESRAFTARLTNTVVERKITLDRVIRLFSRVPFEKIRPDIRNILRLGLAQILFMRVPDRAAVYETVELVKKQKKGPAGYCNALLRQAAADAVSEEGKIKTLMQENPSVRYSVPKWLYDRLLGQYGKDVTEHILEDQFRDHGIGVRVNCLATDPDILEDLFRKGGLEVEKSPLNPVCFRVYGTDTVSRLPGYREGLFMVQDAGGAAAVKQAGIRPGDHVLDLCASPGGKTGYAAELCGPEGSVTAEDISESKTDRIRENVARMKYPNIAAVVTGDATCPAADWNGRFDVVIADVPCTGIGVMGRKNEIKYRVKPADIRFLSRLSASILDTAVMCVRPGGRILFSTCTIFREENQDAAASFLKRHPGFQMREERQFLQGIDPCDGFYYAVFEDNRRH